jgi:hypothetical protein
MAQNRRENIDIGSNLLDHIVAKSLGIFDNIFQNDSLITIKHLPR